MCLYCYITCENSNSLQDPSKKKSKVWYLNIILTGIKFYNTYLVIRRKIKDSFFLGL